MQHTRPTAVRSLGLQCNKFSRAMGCIRRLSRNGSHSLGRLGLNWRVRWVGGQWSMQGEVTWDIFQRVLKSMARGKACGKDGLVLEALYLAPEWVQRHYFKP